MQNTRTHNDVNSNIEVHQIVSNKFPKINPKSQSCKNPSNAIENSNEDHKIGLDTIPKCIQG